jgi:hypothetical protein
MINGLYFKRIAFKSKAFRENSKVQITLLIFLLLLFSFTAPWTVQGGDTGELVTNSFFLRVSHPPGYPLWTLLFHLPVKYLSFTNPFHVAALISSLVSLVWIGLLLFRFKNIESLALVFLTASSLLFWKYSVLPDVFSLHLLFLVLVFLVFIDQNLINSPSFVFVISLSVAHHHTILFAFPMFLFSLFKRPSRRVIFFSTLFGFFSLSFYLILFLFHPEEFGSWGQITDLPKLVTHFLRREYGTWKLQTFKSFGDQHFQGLFFKNLLTDFWSLFGVLIFVIAKHFVVLKRNWIQLSVILISIFSYFFVFHLAGVRQLDPYSISIVERFLLQPLLLIVFIFILIINRGAIQLPRWLLMFMFINIGLNLVQNFKPNNFSSNNAIEDYGLNVLNNLPSNSIYYPKGDTPGFSAYYLHELMGIRKDIVIFPSTILFPWSAFKTSQKYPDAFNLKANIFDGINFERYQYLTNDPPKVVPEKIQVTLFGPIYKLQKVENLHPEIIYNCDISDHFKWRNRPTLLDFGSFDVSFLYDLYYGQCHFQLANKLSSELKIEEAIKMAEKAVELSPFNIHFQNFLCELYKNQAQKDKSSLCLARLEILDGAIHPAYR